MSGDAFAYEALGLAPGADQAAIERAYKALIKRYHPDRDGGDAARASEINEAYFHLRKSVERPLDKADPATLAEALYARRPVRLRRRRKRRSRVWPALIIVAALLLYWRRNDVTVLVESAWAELRSRAGPTPAGGSDPAIAPLGPVSFDDPVEISAVAASVRKATALQRSGDEDALYDESRACHQELRSRPSLELLDRCAAFDDAVLELQRLDPFGDEGPFGATAIASRQIRAGSLLSDDYLAIDNRLNRVRSAVQSLLAVPAANRKISDRTEVAR